MYNVFGHVFLCYFHISNFLVLLQVGIDSQFPSYEIDHEEVDMNEAKLIGEVIIIEEVKAA